MDTTYEELIWNAMELEKMVGVVSLYDLRERDSARILTSFFACVLEWKRVPFGFEPL